VTTNDDTKHIQEALQAKEYHRLPWLITYREQLHREELFYNRLAFFVLGTAIGSVLHHFLIHPY